MPNGEVAWMLIIEYIEGPTASDFKEKLHTDASASASPLEAHMKHVPILKDLVRTAI